MLRTPLKLFFAIPLAVAALSLTGNGSSAPVAAKEATLNQLRVLELYTSQGCAYCPPADRLLGQLSRKPGLMTLSFNVDYWDYLGWRDTLGRAAFSERQRDYARQRGNGRVYTPQMIIDGHAHVLGSDATAIKKILASLEPTGGPDIDIQLTDEGSAKLTIGAGASAPPKPADIFMATVVPRIKVRIETGENRGRSITYHNVVRDLVPIGVWDGSRQQLKLDPRMILKGDIEACAVIIQEQGPGRILAAAWLDGGPAHN